MLVLKSEAVFVQHFLTKLFDRKTEIFLRFKHNEIVIKAYDIISLIVVFHHINKQADIDLVALDKALIYRIKSLIYKIVKSFSVFGINNVNKAVKVFMKLT